jgi:hypothetical protein
MRVGVFIDGQNITIGSRYALNLLPVFATNQLMLWRGPP